VPCAAKLELKESLRTILNHRKMTQFLASPRRRTLGSPGAADCNRSIGLVMKNALLRLAIGLSVYAGGYGMARGQSKPAGGGPRNVLIFVFDGLRAGSVNAVDSPTMFRIREQGVNFTNSHSLFPTFTTANASAIATGHYLGDTGDYSNQIYIGRPVFLDGNFGRPPGSYAPYVENDRVLGDLDAQFNGNYLNEETLLAAARRNGYNTAAVGKMGPAAIQDVSELNPVNRRFTIPQTILIDDGTGTPDGVPLALEISSALVAAGLPTTAPPRDQPTGNNITSGTREPN
jgi:Type I phosphodiesterase / nucleotide pyrophosphatase